MAPPRKHPQKFCKCGTPIRNVSEQCWRCYNETRNLRRCLDCGGKLSNRGKRTLRCQSCWIAYRTARPKKKCSVEGCPHPHKAKGYCIDHYQKFLQTPLNRAGEGRQLMNIVRAKPCQLCGYTKLHSHVHRLVEGKNGGQYEWGNVVALCARCHEEVHRGVTPPPKPLQVPA